MQGSKVGVIMGTRVVLIEQNDRKSKTREKNALKSWRNLVGVRAGQAMRSKPWGCPVKLQCEFVLPRFQSHYTTKGELKKDAPVVPRGDLDKYLRAIGDAMTGIVYVDDTQIVRIVATKRFSKSKNAVGGVRVKVSQVDE